MLIHRSAHTRAFTVLPNALLQDRRLSYTARGLLADLLSRPDGWREDGRQMADRSPQGRLAIAKALKELTAFGYYRVDKVRQDDGTLLSVAHVWDIPQVGPALTRSGSGSASAGRRDALPVKNREEEPSLPAPAVPQQRSGSASPDREGGQTDSRTTTALDDGLPAGDGSPARSAIATLFRVIRPEPRLRLGTVEALDLAPLVARWLEHGCTEADLTRALLQGLPAQVHAPVALLRDRLTRKLPAAPAPRTAAVAAARWHECGGCAAPIPQAGICRSCAGLGQRVVGVGSGHAATASGIAKVRAALGRTTAAPQLCRA